MEGERKASILEQLSNYHTGQTAKKLLKYRAGMTFMSVRLALATLVMPSKRRRCGKGCGSIDEPPLAQLL